MIVLVQIHVITKGFDPISRNLLMMKMHISRFSKTITIVLVATSMIFCFTGLSVLAEETSETPPFAKGVPERFGCLVCHADPKLKNDPLQQSLYMNKELIMDSAHKELACTDCHKNYKTKPTEEHEAESARSAKTFGKVARASCSDCHDHEKPDKQIRDSVHAPKMTANKTDKLPDCVDCHGPHDMRNPKKDKVWAKKFNLSGKDICGQCHATEYQNYDDYYHGRAYKMKAEDAPSCWDCHGWHDTTAVKDIDSMVSESGLVKTCGKCHKDSSESFTAYASLIHGRQKLADSNPLWKLIDQVMGIFGKEKASAGSDDLGL